MDFRPVLPSRLRRHIAALALSGITLVAPGMAAAETSPELTAEQSAAITELGNYINGFQTLQGEFTQTGPKGTVSKGVFYLSKPGKMRFEYSPPNPFIIVSDGTWVTVKNRAKDRADQYPLSQTPLRLVLDEDVNITEEADILDVQSAGDGLVTVTLEDKKKMVPGHLILTYDEKRKALQQWIVVDGKGRRTTVSLENIVAGVEPDPKLFIIKVTRRGQKKN